MSAFTVVVAMIVAAFGVFITTLAGAHLYVVLDPRTRRTRKAQVVQFPPVAVAPARRAAAHA
jgi:hypothetical protein